MFNKDEYIRSILDKGPSPQPSIDNIVVHEHGVYKLLNNLNPHKASGPDGLQTRIFIEIASEFAPVLTDLFQASINQRKIPDDWKTGNVVTIFKKGSKYKAQNYRPVSLNCVASKLLEHILCSSIMKHLDSNKHPYRLATWFP